MSEPVTPISPYRIGRAIASQGWSDVLFVHWRVDAAVVAPLLPLGTSPDIHDGSTWVGLIAFRLGDARLGPIGPVPGISNFVEVNVRLYVVDGQGRRGVVFRSLEAASLLAVLAARVAFGLPYQWAATSGGVDGERVEYRSRRHRTGIPSALAATFDESRVVTDAAAEFLSARWAMYTRHLGRTRRAVNVHEPWVLHPAQLVSIDDGLVAAAGLPGIIGRTPDSVLFSRGVNARFALGGTLSDVDGEAAR